MVPPLHPQAEAPPADRATAAAAAAAAGRSPADVALAKRLLAAARGGADVRARKVRRLRAAIRVRAYENDLKFAVAVEKLLADAHEGPPVGRKD